MKEQARRIFCNTMDTLGNFTLSGKYKNFSKVGTDTMVSYVFVFLCSY